MLLVYEPAEKDFFKMVAQKTGYDENCLRNDYEDYINENMCQTVWQMVNHLEER